VNPKATWAEAPGLITTRRAADMKDKAQKEQETRKYLGRPDPNQEYPFSVIPPSILNTRRLLTKGIGILCLAIRRGKTS